MYLITFPSRKPDKKEKGKQKAQASQKKGNKKGQDQKMVRNSRFAARGNIAKKLGGEAWDKESVFCFRLVRGFQ